MGCVIVRGGSLVSSAYNLHGWGRHAELRALRPKRDYSGCVLYVVRLNGKVSTPCTMCMEAIRKAKISRVVSVNWESTTEVTKVVG